jgi:hypothetical protein
MTDKKYRLCDGVIFRPYGNFGLIVNVPARKNIVIDRVASRILSALGEKNSISELNKKIKRLNLGSKDLIGFIKMLEKRKILEVTND